MVASREHFELYPTVNTSKGDEYTASEMTSFRRASFLASSRDVGSTERNTFLTSAFVTPSTNCSKRADSESLLFENVNLTGDLNA